MPQVSYKIINIEHVQDKSEISQDIMTPDIRLHFMFKHVRTFNPD